jgi:LiaF transmembrane domain
MSRRHKDPREGVAFGLLLIAFGALFLLDRAGVIFLGRSWAWWPWIVIGFGIFKMALWNSAKTVASGLGLVMFGLWFMISVNGWYGLDWSNSWPLALVAVGVGMIARTALAPLFPKDAADVQSGGEPHA